MAFESAPQGLGIEDGQVTGALHAVGLVRVRVTASDGFGGVAEDVFTIAMPAPDPGTLPSLSASLFVYEDDSLPLPRAFSNPLADTTPVDNPTTNEGATLGRVLFYDTRLSITNTHACASCHDQSRGFADSEAFSRGVLGSPTTRNSMALANVRYNHDDAYFADLRVETLERLVVVPIEHPIELGNPMPMLVSKLRDVDFYPPLFEAAFGTPEIDADGIANALAQFLRSLMTYRSRFDRAYDVIDRDATPDPGAVLTAQELRGSEIFTSNPGPLCSACHLNLVKHILVNPLNNGLDIVPTDPGFMNGAFRTASLRNVAVSGPYMHDGRFATLREVIDHYDHGIQDSEHLSPALRDGGRSGPPRRLNLSEEDKNALEAFLNTLTDIEFLNDPKFSDPFR